MPEPSDPPGDTPQPPPSSPAVGRLLRDVRHGGHVLAEASVEAKVLASANESITTLDAVLREPVGLTAVVDTTTGFGYMFGELAADFPNAHLPDTDPIQTVAALKQLGAALVEDPARPTDPLQSHDNSTIPAVYTYWGQFLDHDLTANTDRDSVISDVTADPLTPLSPTSWPRTCAICASPASTSTPCTATGPPSTPPRRPPQPTCTTGSSSDWAGSPR